MGITGITVQIVNRTKTGTNPFGEPIFDGETYTQVDNVLVAPASDTDIVNNTDMFGAKAVYTLAIPKGDTNNWEDAIIEFWGERWHAIGIPQMGIEENIPLAWNKKVTVERYE